MSTQATRSAPPAPVAQQAGDRGGAGGLAEDALVGGEQAVGLEDLVVGDGGARARARPVIAPIASSQRAGLPMRIALATVSGSSTGAPCTSGAAPAAWKPSIRGAEAELRGSPSSRR